MLLHLLALAPGLYLARHLSTWVSLGREISEKLNFFVNRSVPENFQWENFSGQVPTESLRTQDSENVYERWVQQIFDPVLVARSWVSATKWGPLAKLWGVQKKCISQNLRIWASKFKSLGAIDYGTKWFTFGSSNLKILGDTFFFNTANYLLIFRKIG